MEGDRFQGAATMSSVVVVDAESDYGDLATYDLVDGCKVPKKMGNLSLGLAGRLYRFIGNFVDAHELGYVAYETIIRIPSSVIPRRPDVFFVKGDRFDPTAAKDKDPWELSPNLAIEVISKTNTFNEIEEKMEEYFAAGVEAVWVVSNRVRRVTVYKSMKTPTVYEGNESIDAAPVLPGLTIALHDVYSPLGM
jgi:Uma2 family endonuclease